MSPGRKISGAGLAGLQLVLLLQDGPGFHEPQTRSQLQNFAWLHCTDLNKEQAHHRLVKYEKESVRVSMMDQVIYHTVQT